MATKPYAVEIEAIRYASFEAPKAQSATEWEGRITTILGHHDGEVFRELLRHETGDYLKAAKDYLAAISGVTIAWAKMRGLSFEAYVYSAEAGEALCRTLMLLGFNSAAVDSFDHWHDGETHMVRGSL